MMAASVWSASETDPLIDRRGEQRRTSSPAAPGPVIYAAARQRSRCTFAEAEEAGEGASRREASGGNGQEKGTIAPLHRHVTPDMRIAQGEDRSVW